MQEPDGGFEDDVKCAQRPNEQKRDRKRVADRDVFRRQLAEDDVEKSDPNECERDRDGRDQRVRVDVHEREGRLKQADQKLFADPTEREAEERHAELRRGEVGIEMRADVLGENSANVPLLHERVELAGAHFYDGEFARDEKAVQDNEREDYRQLAQDNWQRIPMVRDRFGQRADGEKCK